MQLKVIQREATAQKIYPSYIFKKLFATILKSIMKLV